MLGQLGRLFYEFGALGEGEDYYPSHFRLFSPIIGLLKQTRYGKTHGPTDAQTDPLKEMHGRI